MGREEVGMAGTLIGFVLLWLRRERLRQGYFTTGQKVVFAGCGVGTAAVTIFLLVEAFSK
jgi:hypothetical protein